MDAEQSSVSTPSTSQQISCLKLMGADRVRKAKVLCSLKMMATRNSTGRCFEGIFHIDLGHTLTLANEKKKAKKKALPINFWFSRLKPLLLIK